MIKPRLWLPAIIALLAAAIPLAASADLYINGTGDLKPWDRNQCTYYGQGFRCDLAPGASTLISFHSEKRHNGCGWKVVNYVPKAFTTRWHVELFNGGWASEKCTFHWLNDNTVEILEPK